MRGAQHARSARSRRGRGPPRRGDYEFTMSMTSRCARRRSRRRGPRGAGINAHNVVVCMVHVRTLTLSLNTRMKSKSSGVAAEAPPSGGPGGGKPAQPSLVSPRFRLVCAHLEFANSRPRVCSPRVCRRSKFENHVNCLCVCPSQLKTSCANPSTMRPRGRLAPGRRSRRNGSRAR